MAPLTELSLFSGAGGGLLATQHLLGWQTVCYVELDKYAVDVLKARIRDGYLHDAPIWDNAFTFDGKPWRGLVDIVSAGFPCQPFSTSGKGLAELDPRNGWPATIRIIREVRPRIAWLENVPGLIAKPYFRTILGELSEAGYCVKWDCVSAEEVGAPHKRERLWIIAYAESSAWDISKLTRPEGFHFGRDGCKEYVADPNDTAPARQREHGGEVHAGTEAERLDLGSSTLGNPNSERREKFDASRFAGEAGQSGRGSDEELSDTPNMGSWDQDRGDWWTVEPQLGRVANGVANRMDRLRAIGNGQVPAVLVEAWRRHGGE
jgi:DNA (cytosine-5)-methyltransferase 1